MRGNPGNHLRRCVPIALVAVLGLTGCEPPGEGSLPEPDGRTTSAGSDRTEPAASDLNEELVRLVPAVNRHAGRAGISRRLFMAILYNESYKPHDPDTERAWQRIDPDASFGVANMHRAAFEDTRRGRSFADRDWQELPDDRNLAVQAAAWYLHDLNARLPRRWSGRYRRTELLALGYNAGPSAMRAFARGARPGPVAQDYLDRLHENWDVAGRTLRSAGTNR